MLARVGGVQRGCRLGWTWQKSVQKMAESQVERAIPDAAGWSEACGDRIGVQLQDIGEAFAQQLRIFEFGDAAVVVDQRVDGRRPGPNRTAGPAVQVRG
jgi:hypothetical protein